MVNRALPKLDIYNPYYLTKKWIFHVGWVRWPLVFLGAYAFDKLTLAGSEWAYFTLTPQNSSKDMWEGVARRTKERLLQAAEE